ncbi:hypothetical protein A2911_00085 [Candidatus Nomurabacteria bacterium RIFCSPLOWO2_01_FULL_40_15]|uniref:Primosomal protein N' 3' DNA-binding domain-containing protein n=1 Tax=Candidatus Nomurabacteria bacterium RIFCSPLOWO2_01_FULL_40_15 TaxID=1801772 RepID=A0A1F6X8C3_9BACT|nr:MAG: hypothetical protein A2911_00085 [Candidatus Nomurabacteria bacterium RIFCSPLOWO2_01_FULL_40_15]
MATKTYVVEAAILKKTGGTLTYFSAKRLAPGQFVKARVMGRVNPAIVISIKDVKSAKSDLRRAGFQLKKIAEKDILDAGVSAGFLNAAKKTAFYYATSPGSLLLALLPKSVLEKPDKFFRFGGPTAKRRLDRLSKEPILLQMESEERFGQYRAIVRQSFARKKSVLFIVPTHKDCERVRRSLSQGIEHYVHDQNSWQEALANPHPVLFISTPAGAAFERYDLGIIILERENSRAYRTLARPYIHFKTFFEYWALETGRQLVLGDSVLSLESLRKERAGECSELSLVRWRLASAPSPLIDASAKPDNKGKFEIFSPELKALIHKAINEKRGLFLFASRKGLAPTTVCGDCGYLLPCLNCGAPVVLHESRSDRTFICHACGTRRDSKTVCGYCGSWKLIPLGIGIERIAAEVRTHIRNTPVEILDKDHAPTEAKVRVITERFGRQGGILVGTELAFYHLEKVPYAAIVSADSLFSVPDFGINERIFYLVSRVREMAEIESLVQTRNIGKQILAWAAQGNIINFYQSEIAERENLLYPPFSIFIKIENKDTRGKIQETRNKFLKWSPEIYKNSLIIRIPREKWPEEELVRELSLLPRYFSVKVDPESIL